MAAAKKRTSTIKRDTKETQIRLSLDLDGTGTGKISTGLGFFDHMLTLFAAHAMVDLTLEVKGDLEVDGHHSVEDTGIALGEAFVFRVGLQGRLEAMLGSSLGAAALLALLFGLGHAWGLHLRPEASYAGPGASLLQAMALGVAGLSPVGLLFGVIWSRTRSLGLVVLLHVALDFLPCLPDFLRAWS